MLRQACLLLTGLGLTTVSVADVYKFIDAKGQVQYTDRPETLPAELLKNTKRTDPDEVARLNEDTATRAAAAQQAAADKPKKVDTSADKAERCAKARERYEQVMTSHRIYSTDDKGERQYMDDAQIDKTRADAKSMMDTWCN